MKPVEFGEGMRVPLPWIDWALEHGSLTLQRAIGEKYPFAALLRRELVDALCPEVQGTERQVDLPLAGDQLRWGDVRTPDARSFELIDCIDRAIFGPCSVTPTKALLPPRTDISIGRLHRVSWQGSVPVSTLRKPGSIRARRDEVRASGLPIVISCDGYRITTSYVWGRSDHGRNER